MALGRRIPEEASELKLRSGAARCVACVVSTAETDRAAAARRRDVTSMVLRCVSPSAKPSFFWFDNQIHI
jgi:hypothetical protein